MGFAGEDYGYAIDLGLPPEDVTSLFNSDAEIKAESLWVGEQLRRRNEIARRRGPGVQVRDDKGAFQQVTTTLAPFDSMMTHAADPKDGYELLVLRDRMREWRFYDHFRTDRESPVRIPQVGTRTPVLASDGSDLAASLQTIKEIGDRRALDDAIDDAFPGCSVGVDPNGQLFDLVMRQPGMLRPLRSGELSDGTLRYLLLTIALLTARPPSLLVLNEPETSIHPSLLEPLARPNFGGGGAITNHRGFARGRTHIGAVRERKLRDLQSRKGTWRNCDPGIDTTSVDLAETLSRTYGFRARRCPGRSWP